MDESNPTSGEQLGEGKPTSDEKPRILPTGNPLSGAVTGQREAMIREREREMVELRVAGATLEQIAERYGISISRCSVIVNRRLRAAPAGAKDWLNLILARHDAIVRSYWPTALGLGENERDTKAAATVQKSLDAIARHLGLDKLTIQHESVPQEERAASLADSLRAYLQGVQDATGETDPDLARLDEHLGDDRAAEGLTGGQEG